MNAGHSKARLGAVTGQREENGWLEAVRSYAAANPRARAIDIASALGCTESQALCALSESVWELPATDLHKVLAEIKAWGPVLVLVRNRDAVAEIEAPGDRQTLNEEWLNWIDDGYNLHIRVAATQCILATIRAGRRGPTHSFNLVNQAGYAFCRFYTRTSAAKERFLAFCEAHTSKNCEG
jgi:putative heme degradation protein